MNNQMTTLATINYELMSPAMRDRFAAALCDQRIKFEAEIGFAMQVMQASDYLQKVAASNMESFRAAVVNVAAIGISLNPAKKQAYLVPRKGKVCLDISYMGMMDLAIDTGAIQWGQANIVCKNDRFELRGLDQMPTHEFSPFASEEERGPIVGVYVTVKTSAGDYLTHAMPLKDVLAIRDRSEAWKAFIKEKKTCPWNTDEKEMIKKTCVKQASKYWPKNGRLENAIHHMNTDGGEGLERNMGPAQVVEEGEPIDVYAVLESIKEAKTAEDVAGIRKEMNARCQKPPSPANIQAWATIKAACIKRTDELNAETQETPQ